MIVNSQKSEVRSQKLKAFTFHLLPFTFGLLLLTGCNGNITGSASGTNADLSATHRDGPDCTQSGCHPGFGAGGTVFESAASATPAGGVTVKARSVETGSEITLGISDTLGNFHYDQELSGYYNMVIGDNEGRYHRMPEWKGCNRCHTWPPAGDPTPGGRLY